MCFPGQGGEGRLSQAVCTTLPGLQVLLAADPHPFGTCNSLPQGEIRTFGIPSTEIQNVFSDK